jgi:hypothetical protein
LDGLSQILTGKDSLDLFYEKFSDREKLKWNVKDKVDQDNLWNKGFGEVSKDLKIIYPMCGALFTDDEGLGVIRKENEWDGQYN